MACYIDISQLIENPALEIHAKTNFPLSGQSRSFNAGNSCSVLCALKINNGKLAVQAQAKCILETVCSRCQKTVKRPVAVEFCETVKMSSSLVSDSRFNVQPMVEEAVFLKIPANILCNDNCEGVCAKCGTNLNYSSCFCSPGNVIDRWLPLNKLKFKNIFIGEV